MTPPLCAVCVDNLAALGVIIFTDEASTQEVALCWRCAATRVGELLGDADTLEIRAFMVRALSVKQKTA